MKQIPWENLLEVYDGGFQRCPEIEKRHLHGLIEVSCVAAAMAIEITEKACLEVYQKTLADVVAAKDSEINAIKEKLVLIEHLARDGGPCDQRQMQLIAKQAKKGLEVGA